MFSYILLMLLMMSTLGKKCDHILCSNIFDKVCGIAEVKDRSQIRLIFKNYCYMKKAECEEESFVEVNQVENEFCNLTQNRNIAKEYQIGGRRVNDFSIVGAHQACNHTCPTFCTDTYEPVCAQIWKRNMVSNTYRVMINHCHIDLFSCAAGLNVTIEPLVICFKNPMNLLFMQNIASMKSLRLLDIDPKLGNRRRRNVARRDEGSEISFKTHLKEVVRRIFEKYRVKSYTSEPETLVGSSNLFSN